MSTLTQLGYAVALDRHRNFQRAAKACFVTQPTLSMQLQKLEDELGLRLFDRSRKPVVPTVAGVALLAQFRVVLREQARVQELADSFHGVIQGPYRLGIIPTMAPTVLPALIPTFVDRYPRVQLKISELQTQEILQGLLDERLDAGILATPLQDPRLLEFVLAREALMVYHSPTAALPLNEAGEVEVQDLPLEQLLLMREGHCLRDQTLRLCPLTQSSTSLGFQLEAGSMQTLCRMVQQGPFFTVIPAMCAEELEPRSLKHFVGPVPYREIALVTHRSQTRRAIREAMVELGRELLKEDSGTVLRERPLAPV